MNCQLSVSKIVGCSGWTDRQRDRKTDREKVRETERETDRQRDRERETDRQTETERLRYYWVRKYANFKRKKRKREKKRGKENYLNIYCMVSWASLHPYEAALAFRTV